MKLTKLSELYNIRVKDLGLVENSGAQTIELVKPNNSSEVETLFISLKRDEKEGKRYEYLITGTEEDFVIKKESVFSDLIGEVSKLITKYKLLKLDRNLEIGDLTSNGFEDEVPDKFDTSTKHKIKKSEFNHQDRYYFLTNLSPNTIDHHLFKKLKSKIVTESDQLNFKQVYSSFINSLTVVDIVLVDSNSKSKIIGRDLKVTSPGETHFGTCSWGNEYYLLEVTLRGSDGKTYFTQVVGSYFSRRKKVSKKITGKSYAGLTTTSLDEGESIFLGKKTKPYLKDRDPLISLSDEELERIKERGSSNRWIEQFSDNTGLSLRLNGFLPYNSEKKIQEVGSKNFISKIKRLFRSKGSIESKLESLTPEYRKSYLYLDFLLQSLNSGPLFRIDKRDTYNSNSYLSDLEIENFVLSFNFNKSIYSNSLDVFLIEKNYFDSWNESTEFDYNKDKGDEKMLSLSLCKTYCQNETIELLQKIIEFYRNTLYRKYVTEFIKENREVMLKKELEQRELQAGAKGISKEVNKEFEDLYLKSRKIELIQNDYKSLNKELEELREGR